MSHPGPPPQGPPPPGYAPNGGAPPPGKGSQDMGPPPPGAYQQGPPPPGYAPGAPPPPGHAPYGAAPYPGDAPVAPEAMDLWSGRGSFILNIALITLSALGILSFIIVAFTAYAYGLFGYGITDILILVGCIMWVVKRNYPARGTVKTVFIVLMVAFVLKLLAMAVFLIIAIVYIARGWGRYIAWSLFYFAWTIAEMVLTGMLTKRAMTVNKMI